MNLSILKENLQKGIITVSHITGKNINLPILSNINVSIKKDSIKLISTNLEIGVTQVIRGKVEDECDFTINSKIFSDYINLLPNKKINLTKDGDDIKIECENYKTKIKIESSDDYPLIPEIKKSNKITINLKDFRRALSQVVFAVSNNETRIELSGVLFQINKDQLILAATDSYRLAEKKVKIKQEQGDSDKKIIVPARTIQELIRIISSADDGVVESNVKDIDLYIDDNQILFKIDSTELVSRLIEGQYPDYQQIIPGSGKTSVSVDKSELIRAVKSSAIFAKIGINDVNLDVPKDGKKIIISSTSSNTGENIVEIEADTKGIDNGIIVNYQYLLDGLNNLNSDNLEIEIIDNNTPCVLKPAGDKDFIYIIMPIKQ